MRTSSTDTISTDLLVERRGGIVRLTLNRPQKRNAMSLHLIRRIDSALIAIKLDLSIRVVVIAAEGEVFSSGHDLTELVDRTEDDYHEIFMACSRMMLHIRRLPQPVIAQVQGLATAAGCQLVAACDLAIAAEEASFGTPGINIGLFCTTPMVPLVRSMPTKPALEMLLTGEPISARRAFELGLVNRVVPRAELAPTVNQLAESIEAKSPSTIRLGKDAFFDLIELTEEEAYRRATQVMTHNAMQPDAQEGISAFLEKRAPVWQTED